MQFKRIEVECKSAGGINDEPVAFTFGNKRRIVSEIIDRWIVGDVDTRQPEFDYLKVRTNNGKLFILRDNTLFDAWAINVTPLDDQ